MTLNTVISASPENARDVTIGQSTNKSASLHYGIWTWVDEGDHAWKLQYCPPW
jgi:hypothetical protein